LFKPVARQILLYKINLATFLKYPSHATVTLKKFTDYALLSSEEDMIGYLYDEQLLSSS
jgi:hypothetical protein